MRQGADPQSAVDEALGRIRRRHPTFQGALVAIDRRGNHAAATNCMPFTYAVATAVDPQGRVIQVQNRCDSADQDEDEDEADGEAMTAAA
mmetsp:Transcript_9637/g.24047  ORF Transcript_9637/g.24047 Transcript_9637/m.24047 type:complete len:90 (+) Transcript_9637:574-843(+)